MRHNNGATSPPANADPGPWVITYSGKRLYLLNPQPDAINLQDIAHSLSNQARYNGHTPRFYSVAEHCYLASILAPPGLELAALLHDAAEAYVGDVIAPVKDWLGAEFARRERALLRVIYEFFDVRLDLYDGGLILYPWKQLDHLDRRVRSTEAACLFYANHRDHGWGCEDAPPFDHVVPECWPPAMAELHFLARFHQLDQRRRPEGSAA